MLDLGQVFCEVVACDGPSGHEAIGKEEGEVSAGKGLCRTRLQLERWSRFFKLLQREEEKRRDEPILLPAHLLSAQRARHLPRRRTSPWYTRDLVARRVFDQGQEEDVVEAAEHMASPTIRREESSRVEERRATGAMVEGR